MRILCPAAQPLPERCPALGMIRFLAAPQDYCLPVMVRLGGMPFFRRIGVKRRLAALVFRRVRTISSGTWPPWQSARHSQCFLRAARIITSPRRQMSLRPGCLRGAGAHRQDQISCPGGRWFRHGPQSRVQAAFLQPNAGSMDTKTQSHGISNDVWRKAAPFAADRMVHAQAVTPHCST